MASGIWIKKEFQVVDSHGSNRDQSRVGQAKRKEGRKAKSKGERLT